MQPCEVERRIISEESNDQKKFFKEGILRKRMKGNKGSIFWKEGWGREDFIKIKESKL